MSAWSTKRPSSSASRPSPAGSCQCTPRSTSWVATSRPSSSPAATMAVRHRRRCEATEAVGAASSTLAKCSRLSWRSSTSAMTGVTNQRQ
jgi:hypothetical protein